MKLYELITPSLYEGYKEAEQEFSTIDPNALQLINQYKQLVNKNQVQGNERNIDWWRKQGYEKFSEFVRNKTVEAERTTTQVKRKKLPGKSITLLETSKWLIVIPLDKDASCFHGKNSDWCTTKINQSYFENYFYDRSVTLIYCLSKQTGGMWAIAAHEDLTDFEMFNKQDDSIDSREFQRETGLNPAAIVRLAFNTKHKPTVDTARQSYTDTIKKTTDMLFEFTGEARDPEIEKLLMYTKSGSNCAEYIESIGKNGKLGKQNYPHVIEVAAVNDDIDTIRYLKTVPEDLQMLVLKKPTINEYYTVDDVIKVFYVSKIELTEEAQRYATAIITDTQNYELFKYIINPTEKVQIEAVSREPFMLEYIPNPSHEVQLQAVSRYGNVLRVFKKAPPYDVIIAALGAQGQSIRFLEDFNIEPTEEMKMTAVQQDGNAISWIKNPSIEVQVAAVEQDPWSIRHINNPSDELIYKAVGESAHILRPLMYDVSPPVKLSPELQLKLVERDSECIKYMRDPTEEAQITAYKDNPMLLTYNVINKLSARVLNALEEFLPPNLKKSLNAALRNE